MGLIAITCPNCGANLNVEEERDAFFCSYCGSKVEREKKIVDLKAHVTIDNFINADTLLERAFVFLKDGDFRSAAEYFDRVLDLSPKHSGAHLGLFLCRVGVRDVKDVRPDNIPDDLSDLRRAVQYADEKTSGHVRPLLDSWLQLATDSLKSGEYIRSEKLYQALTAVLPDDPEGYVGLFLSRVKSPSLGAFLASSSGSNPVDPSLIQEADRVSGGQYRDAVDRLERKHRETIESVEGEIRDMERNKRLAKANESRSLVSFALCFCLLCVCIVLFISTIFNVGKGWTFVYVLLALSIVGGIYAVLRIAFLKRMEKRIHTLDSLRKQLEELKKSYAEYYGTSGEPER